MKVAFMGSDAISLPLLQYLREATPGGFQLTDIFTQPDRQTGRGMRLQANAIKTWALEHNLTVHQPPKCGCAETEFVRDAGIDLILVMAYGQMLPESFLQAPRHGVLNLHGSLLPRLRGASPIHTAVALGLDQTGMTLMRTIQKLDAGPIADFEPVPIDRNNFTIDVQVKMGAACLPLLERVLPAIAEERLCFVPQVEARASYCRILDKTDAHLDFHQTAIELANRVRAFQPWPGTSFLFKGQVIRILGAEALKSRDHSAPPGTICHSESDGLSIACGDGDLKISRVQKSGGKPMKTADFLRGFNLPEGIRLESRPMRPLESDRPFPYRSKKAMSGQG